MVIVLYDQYNNINRIKEACILHYHILLSVSHGFNYISRKLKIVLKETGYESIIYNGLMFSELFIDLTKRRNCFFRVPLDMIKKNRHLLSSSFQLNNIINMCITIHKYSPKSYRRSIYIVVFWSLIVLYFSDRLFVSKKSTKSHL